MLRKLMPTSWKAIAFTVLLSVVSSAKASEFDNMPPYKMVRSLQFVQDAVASGDHSANEIQKFLLNAIDQRLRAADQQLFADPRNVDAALIYAMSGGNPDTLQLLASRDTRGYFDNRITGSLTNYLSGRRSAAASIGRLVDEFKYSPLGPYLALVAANAVPKDEPEAALQMFDWARLLAPGTIIEEASLRRSMFIAADQGDLEMGLKYATFYVRRFLHSPYASQYADLLVRLVVDNFESVTEEQISAVLQYMDPQRQREVYLRIARAAAIAGEKKLAVLAAKRAQNLSKEDDRAALALAGLYAGVAEVPTQKVDQAVDSLDAIPAENLSARDLMLREAARIVAEEVLRVPDSASLTQAFDANMEGKDRTAMEMAESNSELSIDSDLPTVPVRKTLTGTKLNKEASQMLEEEKKQAEEILEFVSSKQGLLEDLDKMLKEDE